MTYAKMTSEEIIHQIFLVIMKSMYAFCKVGLKINKIIILEYSSALSFSISTDSFSIFEQLNIVKKDLLTVLIQWLT